MIGYSGDNFTGGGNVASGSDLKQWTWDGSSNLQWQAVEVPGGYYKLVNRTNGMVADGWGATADGSAARQAAWNGGNNQQWTYGRSTSLLWTFTPPVTMAIPRGDMG